MSESDRERWDRRYRDGGYTPRDEPPPYVARWVDHVRSGGRALDLATGTGRTARLLAERGLSVTAVDVSSVAIEQARAATDPSLDITWVAADLDDLDLASVGEGGPWSLVTVVRYRDPALWARIVDVLAPDGWVVVEHHLRTPLDVGGPSTDDFRIAPGELLVAFGRLRVVHHEEVVERSDHPAIHQHMANARIAAVNGSPGW